MVISVLFQQCVLSLQQCTYIYREESESDYVGAEEISGEASRPEVTPKILLPAKLGDRTGMTGGGGWKILM
jgi:hypothetical protein